MNSVAKRFDAEAQYWKENNATDIIAHERKMRLTYTISELKRKNPKTILEIGCGAGYNLQIIAKEFPKAKCVGVDISPEMIKLCKKNNKNKNSTFSVLNIDKKTLNKKFDAVILLGVIGYTPNVEHTLTQVQKHVSENGILIFTFGNSQSLFRNIRESLSRVLDTNILLQSTYNSTKKSLSKDTVSYNPSANNFKSYTQQRIEAILSNRTKKNHRNICFAVGFPIIWRLKNWLLEKLFAKRDPLKLAMTIWVSYQK